MMAYLPEAALVSHHVPSQTLIETGKAVQGPSLVLQRSQPGCDLVLQLLALLICQEEGGGSHVMLGHLQSQHLHDTGANPADVTCEQCCAEYLCGLCLLKLRGMLAEQQVQGGCINGSLPQNACLYALGSRSHYVEQ